MKRWYFLVFALLFFVFGCNLGKPVLSDLQLAACDAASANGRCGKLADLGLVTGQQCCSALDKCCGNVFTGMASVGVGLSDLQLAACDAASLNNNCGMLSDLGVVSESQCCSVLGKCCSSGSVSLVEFKSVLLGVIASYFSDSSVLSAAELKDLIEVYFAASGDVVDLSGVGQYSGESIISIYNKAKGVIQPLSELQVLACNSASQGNTCDRLDELGVVTRQQCCSALNKCCVGVSSGQCVSNADCTKCGNSCIPNSQWSAVCAQPTVTFTCSCVGGSCTKNAGTSTTPSVSTIPITPIIPPGLTVKTLTPQAFRARYSMFCGVASGESINPGETKYYKIDMTKWIEWQRKYTEVYKRIVEQEGYSSCLKSGKGIVDQYNQHCKDGAICMDYSCWPGCSTTLPLQSCSDFTSWVWAFGSSYCATPPDFNYEKTCADRRNSDLAQADADLKKYEDLYKSGNYVTQFSSSLGIGCNAWVGSWGCGEGKNIFEIALGYNQVPVYENINNFKNTMYVRSMVDRPVSAITPTNPIAGIIDQFVCASGGGDCQGNGEWPFVSIFFFHNVYDASNIYLMVHNKEGKKRNFEMEFNCPSAITQQEYEDESARIENLKCSTNSECRQRFNNQRCKCLRFNECNCP